MLQTQQTLSTLSSASLTQRHGRHGRHRFAIHSDRHLRRVPPRRTLVLILTAISSATGSVP